MFVSRNDLDIFFKNIKVETKDSIQAVNKIEQWGLKRGEAKGKYWVPYPYQLGIKHLLRCELPDIENRDDKINAIKKDIQTDYINVANDKWQLGHKNPENPTSELNNIVLQPPIQQKYRDNYIFIDTLTKIPTPKLLIKNNFEPFTESQQLELFKALKKKFENKQSISKPQDEINQIENQIENQIDKIQLTDEKSDIDFVKPTDKPTMTQTNEKIKSVAKTKNKKSLQKPKDFDI